MILTHIQYTYYTNVYLFMSIYVYVYIGCASVLPLARHDLPSQVHRSLGQGVQVCVYMYMRCICVYCMIRV